MSVTSQPWDVIQQPAVGGVIALLRVDASFIRDIYWGVDHKRRRMLVLHSSSPVPREYRLPELREIEFRVEERSEGAVIALSLIDPEKADLFKVLCDDLIGSVANVSSDRDAVRRLMERSYRWHHLLRSSSKRLLSEREQRGLIAELIVLRDIAIPALGAEAAVNAWRGPIGAQQDFLVPGFRVEVKATEPQAPRKFTVSSEHQLDRDGAGGDAVALALVEIARSHDGSMVGETLAELVEAIRQVCAAVGSQASLGFEQRLNAAGFADDEPYSAIRWATKTPLLIDVGIDFPVISATALPAAISRVSYDCDLGGIDARIVLHPFGDLQGASNVE